MSNALATITALSAQATDPNAAVQRRNFARSAEALAEAGAPGFSDYLASASSAKKTDDVVVAQHSNVNRSGPQMDFEDNNFTWSDVGDMINPLQHIPVVGTIYRHLSGDQPKPSTQAMGDMLYGGAMGGLASMGLALVNALSAGTSDSGKPADMQVAEAILGPSTPAATQPILLADATTPPSLAPSPAPTASVEPTPTTPEIKGTSAEPALTPPSAESENYYTVKNKFSSGLRKTAQFYAIKRQGGAAVTADASSTPSDVSTAEAAATPVKTEKQPYGGVLDPMPYQRAAALKGSGTTLMGNTIYARERFGSQSSYSAAKPTTTALPTAQPLAAQTSPALSATDPTPPTHTASTDSASLGQLMHDSAHQAQTAAQTTGAANVLPPELIQDMMTMALEKYNAGSALSVE